MPAMGLTLLQNLPNNLNENLSKKNQIRYDQMTRWGRASRSAHWTEQCDLVGVIYMSLGGKNPVHAQEMQCVYYMY
jgi:hypothetical protein